MGLRTVLGGRGVVTNRPYPMYVLVLDTRFAQDPIEKPREKALWNFYQQYVPRHVDSNLDIILGQMTMLKDFGLGTTVGICYSTYSVEVIYLIRIFCPSVMTHSKLRIDYAYVRRTYS